METSISHPLVGERTPLIDELRVRMLVWEGAHLAGDDLASGCNSSCSSSIDVLSGARLADTDLAGEDLAGGCNSCFPSSVDVLNNARLADNDLAGGSLAGDDLAGGCNL